MRLRGKMGGRLEPSIVAERGAVKDRVEME
jgi:hypothetical protein